MYLIPIALLAMLAVVGAAWSPLFAVIVAAPLFLLFLVYVGLSRRADEKLPTPGARTTPEGEASRRGESGIWGERKA